MAKFSITVEGDDKDELTTALTEALEMLGAEAPAAEEAEGEGGEDGSDLVGGEEGSEEDPTEALRERIKDAVLKIAKKAGGPDKVRAAFKKVKANRLQDVKDKDLKSVGVALGVK